MPGPLLVVQLGGAVADAAGVDQHHPGLSGTRSVSTRSCPDEPGRPRLHAVEELALGDALPLRPPPRARTYQGGGLAGARRRWAGPRGRPGGRRSPGRRRRALVARVEVGKAVDLVAPQVDTHGQLGVEGNTSTIPPARRARRGAPPGTPADSRGDQRARRARAGRDGRRGSPPRAQRPLRTGPAVATARAPGPPPAPAAPGWWSLLGGRRGQAESPEEVQALAMVDCLRADALEGQGVPSGEQLDERRARGNRRRRGPGARRRPPWGSQPGWVCARRAG